MAASLRGVERWERLGRRIRDERLRLGYRTLDDLSRATGLSVATVGNLERGSRDRYSEATIAAVEHALGWEPGSIEQVLRGAKPTRVADDALASVLAAWPQLDARAKLAVVALIQALAGGT